jgi:hypothetical protein
MCTNWRSLFSCLWGLITNQVVLSPGSSYFAWYLFPCKLILISVVTLHFLICNVAKPGLQNLDKPCSFSFSLSSIPCGRPLVATNFHRLPSLFFENRNQFPSGLAKEAHFLVIKSAKPTAQCIWLSVCMCINKQRKSVIFVILSPHEQPSPDVR